MSKADVLTKNAAFIDMSRYRRSFIPGGTYFFTVALADRKSVLLTSEIDRLRYAYRITLARWPFETVAICVLPEHLHAIWTLPLDDSHYAVRWQTLKRVFSSGLPAAPERSQSKINKREKGLWQRRFWEHQIRDEADLQRHVEYIYYNPVKHGWVQQVKDWPYSSFHRDVQRGIFPIGWGDVFGDFEGSFGE